MGRIDKYYKEIEITHKIKVDTGIQKIGKLWAYYLEVL